MPTYLLKWDATKWDWRNLAEQAEAVKNGVPVSRTWSCGIARRIAPGDRVFILRLGREPRGIVGAGRVTRGSYEAPGLEQQDGARAKGNMYVDLRFDALFEPRREAQLPRTQLGQGALAAFMWDVQQSGAQIPDAVAQELEQAWAQRVAGGAAPAVAPAGPSIAEQERAAAEKAEQERLANEKTELERKVREAAEHERVAREKAEQARAEQERLGKEKSELERRVREAAEQERLAREKAEREKAERERAAKEKAEREAAERERIAREKEEHARQAKEQAARAAAKPAAAKTAAAPAPKPASPGAPAPTAPRPAMYPEIVADYFAMLAAELGGALYSKADHRARLAAQLGLDDADAIDVGHQQVSSVLLELGLPVIDSFRPIGGSPATLRSAVHAWIEAHPAEVERLWMGGDASKVPVPVELDDSRAFHMPLPPRADFDAEPPPRWIPAAALDLDFRVREMRDELLAIAGQRFVLAFERARLREAGRKDLIGRIEWVAQDRGDSFGFQVRSFDDAGEPRLIVVKTTNFGARFPFTLSALELATAREQGARCCLYRVFGFSRGAKLWLLEGPLEAKLRLAPADYLAAL